MKMRKAADALLTFLRRNVTPLGKHRLPGPYVETSYIFTSKRRIYSYIRGVYVETSYIFIYPRCLRFGLSEVRTMLDSPRLGVSRPKSLLANIAGKRRGLTVVTCLERSLDQPLRVLTCGPAHRGERNHGS